MQLLHYITLFIFCQPLFWSFFKKVFWLSIFSCFLMCCLKSAYLLYHISQALSRLFFVNSLWIRLNSFAKFFSSYSSGLSCSPEPFTFVSLLSLSLSLEATCLFYHFYAILSTPFFAFCFFYTLFPFSYLFLSILLRSFVPLIQKWQLSVAQLSLWIVYYI